MKKIKLELQFSEDEMKSFLIKKGYSIEEHSIVTPRFIINNDGHTTNYEWPDNLTLALSENNSDINQKNEFKKIFEKIIKENFKNIILENI